MEGNRLLTVCAVVAVLAAAVLGYRAFQSGRVPSVDPGRDLAGVPTPRTPDSDGPADTLKAIKGAQDAQDAKIDAANARIERVLAENAAYREQIEGLSEANRELVEQISRRVDERVAAASDETNETLSGVNEALRTIRGSFSELGSSVDSLKTRIESDDTEVPVGLGLTPSYPSGTVIEGHEAVPVVWINPLDSRPGTDGVAGTPRTGEGGGSRAAPSGQLFASTTTAAADGRATATRFATAAAPSPDLAAARPADSPVPYFTLPDLSALVNSTSLTALIGRVYIDDEITNPYPFKIVVGRDNLTASGFELPDAIESMIFEGYGVGDWPLSCVRGYLNAATFIFDDGTVRSAYPGDPGSRPESATVVENAIGYISDPWGNTCVPGRRITDAPAFLAQRTLLAGAEGYASALREQEIERVTFAGPDGAGSSSVVNGDALDFARASAYVGAVRETTDWLRERQQQSFDAIYLPSGGNVTINLQQELRLDLDLDGRRIVHRSGEARHDRLD